eukprot:CAMPEP_0201503260 /NCGR_PEP_ID=MMETSP0151_2-20130828/84568_1 /ASSEMBLY_ACC=CAM_ASM_000257 /TAXON_ID=200890 /ORGANISM="Paramoeba atlantica, Strain 621/1 / CCAP 1560/9" /LENGTH=353 /DNA_ID=CAMNT_0047896905 /DNA_START=691 /DNA_END=1749 /DNA_ORIENTATION=+
MSLPVVCEHELKKRQDEGILGVQREKEEREKGGEEEEEEREKKNKMVFLRQSVVDPKNQEPELIGECTLQIADFLRPHSPVIWFRSSLSHYGSIEGKFTFSENPFPFIIQMAQGFATERGIFEAQLFSPSPFSPPDYLDIRYAIPPLFPLPEELQGSSLIASVSLADQSVLGSVESKVSEVLNMIDSEKMKTMFPSKVKKVSEMTEVEICDFVFQVCRHQSSFFSDMVWDLLQTTFSYPPLALQFSKTEYIHDFVVLLSSAFALSPSPKANRTQAFALKTIAHLSASLSRNQKELKDIGAVKYVENALRAISHGRLTMVEIEAARALYCLCFGLAGGSVANRQELTNISEINW